VLAPSQEKVVPSQEKEGTRRKSRRNHSPALEGIVKVQNQKDEVQFLVESKKSKNKNKNKRRF